MYSGNCNEIDKTYQNYRGSLLLCNKDGIFVILNTRVTLVFYKDA